MGGNDSELIGRHLYRDAYGVNRHDCVADKDMLKNKSKELKVYNIKR